MAHDLQGESPLTACQEKSLVKERRRARRGRKESGTKRGPDDRPPKVEAARSRGKERSDRQTAYEHGSRMRRHVTLKSCS
jgi:hypothetical protein